MKAHPETGWAFFIGCYCTTAHSRTGPFGGTIQSHYRFIAKRPSVRANLRFYRTFHWNKARAACWFGHEGGDPVCYAIESHKYTSFVPSSKEQLALSPCCRWFNFSSIS